MMPDGALRKRLARPWTYVAAPPGLIAELVIAHPRDELGAIRPHRPQKLGQRGDRPPQAGEQRQHRQVGLVEPNVGPENHLAQVRQQRFSAPGLGVEVRDTVQLGLDPVVLHPTLTVQAQILGTGAVGLRGDVLGGQRVQPAEPLGPGDRDDEAVRAVDHHGIVLGRALLAEGIAVVPDGAGVG